MTREEAKARLEANRGAFVFKETNEALDMAIEALSAEPTDLISRTDAIACLSHGEGCGHSCKNRIKALPSADRPSGEWIFNGDGKEQRKSWFICDQCGQSLFHKTNYCPNCGAKMGVKNDQMR